MKMLIQQLIESGEIVCGVDLGEPEKGTRWYNMGMFAFTHPFGAYTEMLIGEYRMVKSLVNEARAREVLGMYFDCPIEEKGQNAIDLAFFIFTAQGGQLVENLGQLAKEL